jgi:hypothetical protein
MFKPCVQVLHVTKGLQTLMEKHASPLLPNSVFAGFPSRHLLKVTWDAYDAA